MAQRVVLHVGVMKSGTSYLQRLLVANRDLLARRGLLFPGESWNDQVRAVAEVLGRKRVVAKPREGSWQELVDELAAWPGVGVVSMEYLAPAGPPKIEAVVSSFPAGTVEVVLTARDLGRAVPAMWQETLKNGRFRTFADYVAAVRADEALGHRFWREQDLAGIAGRWGSAVGAERTTLVTVPRPGAARDLLWQRFAEALGVDGSGVDLPGSGNESLGAASAQLLRRLNERLDGMDFADYAPRVKHRLAKGVLSPRRGEEPGIGFDPPAWLCERSAAMLTAVQDQGVRVVGDLGELAPVPVPGTDPDAVPAEDLLSAAVAGLEGLVRAPGERGKGR